MQIKKMLIIFMIAVVARIGLNVFRQEVFFHKPFLLTEGQLDERTSGDSLWYIWAAEGFLAKKGIMTLPAASAKTYNIDTPDYQEWKAIDNNYIAHKIIPPLYPLFLALCYFIGGFGILSYFIPQLILSAFTCLLIYLIANELFNDRIALWAGLTVALYPDMIFWTSFVRTETLFIFLLSLFFLLLIKGNSQKNLFLISMSAVVFGLACLTRITITPFMPILFFWQLLSFSKSRMESLKIASLMIVIIFLVLLPWGIRNYAVFNEFSILTDEAGILVGSIGNGEQYRDVAINKAYDAHNSLLLKTVIFIKDNFQSYAASCWHRFITFWSPFTHIMKPWAKFYKGLTWLAIFPAAFWGMAASRKKWRAGTELIVIFIFFHSLLHSASFVDLGLVYRYPIQPFLCIFSAYTFNKIFSKNGDH